MRYNIRVTNRETKTTWNHDDLTKDDISWITCDPNLSIEVRSEYQEDSYNNYRREPKTQEEE
jgi:hypothetical protein